jgi:cell division protein FtsA
MENYISIDIGTKNIKIILVSKSENKNSFKIISKKSYASAGISFSYISDSNTFFDSFEKAIRSFEKENNIIIDEAFFTLSGFGIKSIKSVIVHQTADGFITDFDLESVEQKALSELRKKTDNEIIEEINIKTSIDSFEHFSNPIGLRAKKFSSEFLFITQPKNNIIILENILEKLEIAAVSSFPALISSSEFSLSELDKKLGCALVDIGDDTISVIVFDNNKPVYYNVLKGGSREITQLISSSEKVDFVRAELLKESKIINRKVEKIIKTSIESMAKKIAVEIEKAGQENILPGGVTLVGGGSKL